MNMHIESMEDQKTGKKTVVMWPDCSDTPALMLEYFKDSEHVILTQRANIMYINVQDINEVFKELRRMTKGK